MNLTYLIAGIIVVIVVAMAAVLVKSGGSGVGTTVSTTPQTSAAVTSTSGGAYNSGGSTTAATTAPATTIASGNATSVGNYSIGLAYNSTVGEHLVNATGWTLYLYTIDTPNNGKSACYGSCAIYWHPFYASKIVLPAGLNASDFGTINRTGGVRQSTYKGWPLYQYSGDRAPGQINGQGILSTWYVVTPSLKYS